jgi:glycosyltransferase involved in cell wall biosynthesis
VAGEEGLYFRAAAPATLAERLEEVRQGPEQALEAGRSMARRAAEFYDWDRVTDQYARLFQQLASRTRSSR